MGHVGHLLAVVLQLTVVGALAVSAVTPRPEDEFRVGMVGQGGLEFARTVACVVVHLGQVLDELGLGFGVAAPPVFVGHAVRVVVLPIDVVLVDLTVAVVVPIVHRTVVHVVVGTVQFTLRRRTRPGNQGPGGTEGRAPFELVVAVQVHTVAVLVDFFLKVRKRRHAGEGVVAQVLPPAARGAGFPRGCRTEDLAVVDVPVHVEHGHDVQFAAVEEVDNPLLAVVLVHAKVARTAGRTVPVGVLVGGFEGKAVAVVVEDAIAVGVAPAVLVHTSVAVVVVADVVHREGDDLKLHHGHLHRHPLTGVVVADDEHVRAIGVVSVVADEFVVFSSADVRGDLHPRGRVAVIPALVGVSRGLFPTGVGATVHAFVELKHV